MTELQYITMDTNSWINTGIKANPQSVIYAKLSPQSVAASIDWATFWGANTADDAGDTYQLRQVGTSQIWKPQLGGTWRSGGVGTFVYGNDYEITFDVPNSLVTINNDTYTGSQCSWGSPANYPFYPIYVGANNKANSGYRASGAKWYAFYIIQSGVKVIDLIPVIDENNVVCFYDKVSGNYFYNAGSGTFTAGPTASSIRISASKNVLAASGETITISIVCENSWTATEPYFFTLSQTAGTGNSTITLTAPANTGATYRTGTVVVTDSVTGDYDGVTIKQKYPTSGQPFYLGADEIAKIYLGADAITEAYLGDVLVFSSGPFVGLKITPSSISFNSGSLTGEIKVKSSETWTMTVPSWISASVLTGGTGETTVTLTATTQSSGMQDTITVSSANYSASTYANYDLVQFVDYVHSLSMGNNNENYLTTSFYPTNATRGELIFQHRGYTTGNVLVGMYGLGKTSSDWDDKDWRFFTYANNYNMDLGSSRIANNLNGFVTGQDYDISFGNNYIINNTNGLSVTGSTQSPTYDHLPIDICLGVVWVKEVKLWEGETLIFDGKAAVLGGVYGLWDTVSSTFLTTTDFYIEGECGSECQCVNAGGEWINGECVYSSGSSSTARTIRISNIPTPPFGNNGTAGRTDVSITDENENYAYLTLGYDDPEDETSYEENIVTTEGFTASYASGYFEAGGEWGDDITIEYTYNDIGCEIVPSGYETEQPTFVNNVINTSFPTPEPDLECECTNQGGEWDSENQECIYPDPCAGYGSQEECQCVENGGTWVVPEEGEPYCEGWEDPCIEDPCSCDPNPDECHCIEAGGTWGEGYCDCAGDPECECITAGGEWDGSDCIYPE